MKNKPTIFVIPSWYPPYGGSFFVEQTEVLNEISKQIVLYAHPIQFFDFIKKPIYYLKKLFKVFEENNNGVLIYRKYFLAIPYSLHLSIRLSSEKRVYKQLYENAVSKINRPDLIHVHSSVWAGWSAFFLSKKHNIPYIITEHRGRFTNNKYIQEENQLPNSFNKYLSKVFSNSSYVCPVSSAMIDKIKEYCLNINIRPIHNMINEDLFFYEKIKKREKFTFIVVAGLLPSKGIDILLYAFEQTIKEFPNIELFVIGSGPEKDKLQIIIKELNIASKVFFLGHQSRELVAKYMKESHVFVLPTKYEGFSVAVAEALGCGVPVITTLGSGGADNFINSENGTLVEINNISQLSSAMKNMIKNYSKYDKKKIARDTKAKIGKEQFQKQYLQVYKKILNENKNKIKL